MKLFAIIVTYNAMQWVDRCLTSLRESSLPITPIIIDNGSTDETINYIRTHYPEAQLTANAENHGFGHANNQGIEIAYKQGATHFFLLNQDAWVHEDTMALLTDIIDRYQYAIVSPIHLNGKGDKLDFGCHMLIAQSKLSMQFFSDLILGKDFVKDCYDIETMSAAAWLISRKTIEEIGGFDPVFFQYGEDENYIRRVRFHHGRIAIVPNAFIHHDRKQHGNMKMFNKQQILNDMRTTFMDINLSEVAVTKYRLKVVGVHFILFFKSLCSLRLNLAWRILSSYVLFTLQIPEMVRHNRENRKIGYHWLNL